MCLVGMCPIEKSSPEAFLPANNIADASGFEDEVRALGAAASLARAVSHIAVRISNGRPSAVGSPGQMPGHKAVRGKRLNMRCTPCCRRLAGTHLDMSLLRSETVLA